MQICFATIKNQHATVYTQQPLKSRVSRLLVHALRCIKKRRPFFQVFYLMLPATIYSHSQILNHYRN